MNFANFMAFTRVVEDTLGSCRLTSINVGHDAEVTIILNLVAACHDFAPKVYQR